MDKLFDTFRRLGGRSLLKQWMRAGVLPYAAAQAALTGLSRKSLEIVRLGVQLKIQRKLARKYLPVLKRFDEEWRKVEKKQEDEEDVPNSTTKGVDIDAWIRKEVGTDN